MQSQPPASPSGTGAEKEHARPGVQVQSLSTESPHKISETKLQKFTAHAAMDPSTKEMVAWIRRKIRLKGFKPSEVSDPSFLLFSSIHPTYLVSYVAALDG